MRQQQQQWLAFAALALLAARLAAAQGSCGNIDAKSNGAKGDGSTDDAGVFGNMDTAPTVGIIYLPAGNYRIGSSLTLNTPIMAEEGAVFIVDSGATLTIQNQPEHPLSRFFGGQGKVVFGDGGVRVFPEWFGAVGNGNADDAGAVARAYAAASEKGSAMLYLTQTYGIGSELVFPARATVMSEPQAKFVAVGGNGKGITYPLGGFAYKNVLPNLEGFGDFCFRLQGSDLGAFQLQTLSRCGDAIRFEGVAGGDQGTLLDNTIWFDKIIDSRDAIAFRAGAGCEGEKCIYQGNHVVGNLVQGGAPSGDTRVVSFYFGGSLTPAWDSNQINIGTVTPSASNPNYAFMHCAPGASGQITSNRMVIKVASFGALPNGGRMFTGQHNMLQVTINLAAPLRENALGVQGQLNLVELTGETQPKPGAPAIAATTAPNTRAQFNGGKALVGNYFSLIARPKSDWAPGEIQQFFIYHQMALGNLYQIKCNAPKQKGTGLPIIGCTQAQDNTMVPASIGGSMVQQEVALWMINMSGAVIRAGSNVPFGLAVATLGAAP